MAKTRSLQLAGAGNEGERVRLAALGEAGIEVFERRVPGIGGGEGRGIERAAEVASVAGGVGFTGPATACWTFLDQAPLWRDGAQIELPLRLETVRRRFTRQMTLSR